jgi:fibronectin type 3 domain-containing protein
VKPPYGAAAAALLLSGCGYIGEPMYPLVNVPNRVTDLAAVERGAVIVYQFTLPSLTTEGKRAKIGKVEIRAGVAPDGSFNRDVWLSKALDLQAKPDEKGHVMSEVPATPWVGKDVILGVRAYGVNGRASDWSNLVTVTVIEPLTKAAGVVAVAVAEGVHVSWQGPGGQYKVFRRVGDEPLALVATVETNQWLDPATEFGKRYRYIVQAVRKAGVSEAESEPSETAEVTPVDVFPPAVPAGLNAIAATKNIELVWDRNTEQDVAGYRLYRAVGDGELQKIADIQEAPSYSDRAVESGKVYRYAVSAVDRLGNESKQSAPVEVAAP